MVIELGNPDSLLVVRIVRVGISSGASVSLGGATEQIPVRTLRSCERIAITVLSLILTVTETGYRMSYGGYDAEKYEPMDINGSYSKDDMVDMANQVCEMYK